MRIKYLVYHLISHNHYMKMNRELDKQRTKILDDKKFRKSIRKFIKHADKFDKWQIEIDILERRFSDKYKHAN